MSIVSVHGNNDNACLTVYEDVEPTLKELKIMLVVGLKCMILKVMVVIS